MADPINEMDLINPVLSSSKLQSIKGKPGKQELEKACHDFESLFVNYMLQQMRRTIPEETLFGGGQAEKIYTGMLDSELSKSISRQRGIGLAKLMYTQMAAMVDNGDTKK